MEEAETELPHLKWATFVFFLSLGIFPLGFYSIYPLTSILWSRVSDCIEDRGLYCSASLLGKPLFYFIPKPEYCPRHLDCDWCRPAVTFCKCSLRSLCLPPRWGSCGPWRKAAFCGKEKDPHRWGEGDSTSCRSRKTTWCSLWPQQQGPEVLRTLWNGGLLKVMFANPLSPWLGNEIHRFKVVCCFGVSIPPESL